MSFLANPLVASLAGAVGLGDIVPGGAATSAGMNPSPTPKASAPNQPEYRQARFYDPRSPQSGGMGRGSSMPTEPGAMSPDVQNNPTVMDLLNHFGVHPQQQVDPHLFIHNAQAWANHPVMSGVAEGLLSGLANTKGSDTVWEGLSNATTRDQQIQHVNAQLQMPFQQAMTVASLQNAASKQAQEDALQKYNLAHANMMDDYWTGRNQGIQTTADARVQAAQTTADARIKSAQISGDARVRAEQARPSSASASQWSGLLQGEIRKLTPNGEEVTPDITERATQSALEKLQGTTSAKTQSAIAVKKTMSGGSATAGAGAPGAIDQTRRAQITAAEEDIKSYDTNKGFVQGDASKGEPPVILKTDPLYAKKRQALVDKRNALIGSAPSKYSPNNPYAPK